MEMMKTKEVKPITIRAVGNGVIVSPEIGYEKGLSIVDKEVLVFNNSDEFQKYLEEYFFIKDPTIR